MNINNKQEVTNQPTMADIMAEMKRLKEENEALKQSVKVTVKNGLKVSEKGAVSLYGLGRFPISLYAEQWRKVFAMQKEVLDFILDGERQGVIKPKEAKVVVKA